MAQFRAAEGYKRSNYVHMRVIEHRLCRLMHRQTTRTRVQHLPAMIRTFPMCPGYVDSYNPTAR